MNTNGILNLDRLYCCIIIYLTLISIKLLKIIVLWRGIHWRKGFQKLLRDRISIIWFINRRRHYSLWYLFLVQISIYSFLLQISAKNLLLIIFIKWLYILGKRALFKQCWRVLTWIVGRFKTIIENSHRTRSLSYYFLRRCKVIHFIYKLFILQMLHFRSKTNVLLSCFCIIYII